MADDILGAYCKLGSFTEVRTPYLMYLNLGRNLVGTCRPTGAQASHPLLVFYPPWTSHQPHQPNARTPYSMPYASSSILALTPLGQKPPTKGPCVLKVGTYSITAGTRVNYLGNFGPLRPPRLLHKTFTMDLSVPRQPKAPRSSS